MDTEMLQKQQEIVAEFNALPDVDAKYAYLFNLAEKMPEMDPKLKMEDNLVSGCQSDLWCHLGCQDGRVYLSADSESLVIKGIAALLMRVINGSPLANAAQLDLDFVDQLKIWKLPWKRNNSLTAMLDHIHRQARDLLRQDASKKEEISPCQN